jgi:hypothetical protein
VERVSNLIALFNLGHFVGPLRYEVRKPGLTPSASPFHQICAAMLVELENMRNGKPLPFRTTLNAVTRLKNAIDSIYAECRLDRQKFDTPLDRLHVREIEISLSALETHLKEELDAMPIWLVTARRAYSIDILISSGEDVLEKTDAVQLSPKTAYDLRQAGRCVAFDLPTAVGFHSVRAVEAVARGYHTIIVGTRLSDDIPLGPLINALRTARDAQLRARTISKDDLLNIAIDFLNRLNNVYRKPLTHPDMVLDLPRAMTVFDSSKCAIELMLEDAGKKYSTPPIPPGFF